MLYRLVIDGIDYLDFQQSDLILLKPKLELEISQAGNLEFTLPPYHRYYDGLHILTSTVEVYEDDRLIWYGRPVEQKVDFYKQKTIYCEGPLSFFNDTVQVPYTYNEVELSKFFNDIITYHNRWVAKDRRFEIGNITIDDEMVYRKIDYESTYNILKGMCLDTVDGYFFFRRENGINYIDWVKDIPYSCNQTIEFGINLLDYTSDFDATEFATCILPIGKTVNQDEGPITIWSVNNNSDVLESEAVSEFGRVTRVQRWSEIEDPTELKAEAQRYLDNTQFNSLIIECNAADLHSLNNEKEIFQLGQNVHVFSNPHFIDRDFPISKMTINLDSAAKTITLGILKKKTLTRIYKEDTEQPQDDYGYDDGDGGYDDWPGTWTDEDGDPWVLVPPDEDGGPVTATKMPTHITVAREPNKMNYQNGETIDFTGLLVRIWCNDKVWTGDGRTAYKDGHAPMRELSFSSKKAILMPVVTSMDQTIAITWTYKGKAYKTKLVIHVGEVTGFSDLRNWTKHNTARLVIGKDTVTGQMAKGYYERISYKIDTGKNRNGVFSLSFAGSIVDGDSGSQVNHHTYIAVCTRVPGVYTYMEMFEGPTLNKTRITGPGTYNVPFNSGDNESVYLIIDWAAIKDGISVDYHYSNISLSLQ